MQNTSVKTFESALFGSLITFVDDKGAPWFVAKQVAEKLGFNITNTASLAHTLNRHCPDKRSVQTLYETYSVLPKGVRKNSAVISEADLYKLVMGSTLPEATAFQDWVTREVLPSIRNHGGYHTEQIKMADQYADPEVFAKINSTMADFGLAIANITTAMTSQNELLANLVKEVANLKSPDTNKEDDVPQGYETRNRVWAKLRASYGAGCMNNSAFCRMMENVAWPTVRFNRFNRDGLLVPVPYLKPIHSYKGEDVTPAELMFKVMQESMQITEHKYTHVLTGDYIQ